MPVTSEAQLRAMYAASEGKSSLGIPKGVGQDFVDASQGIKDLPARAPAVQSPKRKYLALAKAAGQR